MADKKKLIYRLIILTLVIAIVVMLGVIYLPGLLPANVEQKTVRQLDFDDQEWIERIVAANVTLFKKDFLINAAYVYSSAEGKLVLTYATKAEMDELRTHFKGELSGYNEDGTNDQGNLAISGFVDKRQVKVRNYFSEVTNIIEITLVFDGQNEQMLRQKVMANFPGEAFSDNTYLNQFMTGESTSGYVLYDYDEYSDLFYAGRPIFSRSYGFDSTLNELTGRINDLGEHYQDPATAIVGNGEALIKENGYLLSVSAIEIKGEIKTVLTVQRKP